jgi:hypothetical protein
MLHATGNKNTPEDVVWMQKEKQKRWRAKEKICLAGAACQSMTQ